jgi:hypothetical protein
MSLGLILKGAEGIVLAADSRVTIFGEIPGLDPNQKLTVPSAFDNATKLLKVSNQKYVAAVTFGIGAIGEREPRTASSFMPEFEAEISNERRLTVEAFAQKLGGFFLRQWANLNMPVNPALSDNMIFMVGGYDEGKPYGTSFVVQIPSQPKPHQIIPDGTFGINWGGQQEVVERLIRGFDPSLPNIVQEILNIPPQNRDASLGDKLAAKLGTPIPFQFLPLQDCVDLAILLVRTTISLQKFTVGIRGVGGAVDVATITRTEGFKEIQVKQVVGERGLYEKSNSS